MCHRFKCCGAGIPAYVSLLQSNDILTSDIMPEKVSGTSGSAISWRQRGFQPPSIYLSILIDIMSGMSERPVCRGFLPDIIPDVSIHMVLRQAVNLSVLILRQFQLT